MPVGWVLLGEMGGFADGEVTGVGEGVATAGVADEVEVGVFEPELNKLKPMFQV